MIKRLLSYFEHYQQLGERDRKAARLGLICLPVLIYLVVIHPAFNFYQSQRQAFAESRDLLLWMEENRARVSAETGSKPQALTDAKPQALPDGDLLQFISVAAEKHKISFDRLQPVGENQVRVHSEKANFASLVAWLTELQQQGMALQSIRIESASTPGVVGFQGTLSW